MLFSKQKANNQIYRTAMYLRLSREDGDKSESDSIVNQRALIHEYLKTQPNLCCVDEFVDDGGSGVNFERPAFLRMYEDLKSGAVNCIVMKDLSRFGRDYLETGYYIETLFPHLDIRFIAINDNYDSNDPHSRGSLMVPIKDMLNDYYSKDISRKVSGTFEMKRQKGENIHVVPYGYKKDSENPSKFAIDEAVADYVRLIFTAYASWQSISEITKKLNEIGAILPYWRRKQLGLARPSDKVTRTHWVTTDIVQILDNPVYTGDMVYNRLSYPNGYKKRRRSIQNPSGRWYKILTLLSFQEKCMNRQRAE